MLKISSDVWKNTDIAKSGKSWSNCSKLPSSGHDGSYQGRLVATEGLASRFMLISHELLTCVQSSCSLHHFCCIKVSEGSIRSAQLSQRYPLMSRLQLTMMEPRSCLRCQTIDPAAASSLHSTLLPSCLCSSWSSTATSSILCLISLNPSSTIPLTSSLANPSCHSSHKLLLILSALFAPHHRGISSWQHT